MASRGGGGTTSRRRPGSSSSAAVVDGGGLLASAQTAEMAARSLSSVEGGGGVGGGRAGVGAAPSRRRTLLSAFALLFGATAIALLVLPVERMMAALMEAGGGGSGRCVMQDDGTCASPWADDEQTAPAGKGCPMGYGTEAEPGEPLPPGHPPVKVKGRRRLETEDDGEQPAAAQPADEQERAFSTGPRAIFVNGTIWTARVSTTGYVVGTERHKGLVVGQNGRVTLVGSETAAWSLATPDTTVVDLRGNFAAPGFVDAHLHLLLGGWFLARWCDLSTPSLADHLSKAGAQATPLRYADYARAFASKLSSCAAALPQSKSDAWVLGYGWDATEWGDDASGEGPTQADIDRAVGERNAWALRKCGHAGLASTSARATAGLPPWDESAATSSLLREADASTVVKSIPPPNLAERRAALAHAQRFLHARGVTAVHDMGLIGFVDPTDSAANAAAFLSDVNEVYDSAQAKGQLALRVYAFAPLAAWRAVTNRTGRFGRSIGPRLRLGGVKAFVDGSLGAETARFYAPYGVRGGRGEWAMDRDWLASWTKDASDAGLQVALHAIGDEAVDVACDLLAEARSKDLARTAMAAPRHRVEHAQHLSPEGAQRLRSARVYASVQPLHMVSDAPKVSGGLGTERAQRAYAFKTIAQAGVPLGLGSDWFVAEPDPLQALRAAALRDGPEALSPEDALVAHTAGAARSGLDDLSGVFAPDSNADLVVLSADPTTSAGLATARVLRTFVAGAEVYRAASEP